MSETKKRKVHTPEYKAKVGLEALRSDRTAASTKLAGNLMSIGAVTDRRIGSIP